jgi:hypothetical protein
MTISWAERQPLIDRATKIEARRDRVACAPLGSGGALAETDHDGVARSARLSITTTTVLTDGQ